MTSPSLLRRLEAAESALLGAPVAVLVAPDPDAPAEVATFEQRLAGLRANPHRQIIIVNTGIRRGELS
jgi:hypothetical protein